MYCSMVVFHKHKSFWVNQCFLFFLVGLTEIRKYDRSQPRLHFKNISGLCWRKTLYPGIFPCDYIFRADEYQNTQVLLLT